MNGELRVRGVGCLGGESEPAFRGSSGDFLQEYLPAVSLINFFLLKLKKNLKVIIFLLTVQITVISQHIRSHGSLLRVSRYW